MKYSIIQLPKGKKLFGNQDLLGEKNEHHFRRTR